MKTLEQLINDNFYSKDLVDFCYCCDDEALMTGTEENMTNLDMDEDTAFIYEVGNAIADIEDYYCSESVFRKKTIEFARKCEKYLVHRCEFMSFKDALMTLDDFLIENYLD